MFSKKVHSGLEKLGTVGLRILHEGVDGIKNPIPTPELLAQIQELSNHFGGEGGWEDGDFDGSGDVQFADFLLLSDNFGKSATAAAAVPEPSVATPLVAGLVCLLRRRRG